MQAQAVIAVHVNVAARLNFRIQYRGARFVPSHVFNFDFIPVFTAIRLHPPDADQYIFNDSALQKRKTLLHQPLLAKKYTKPIVRFFPSKKQTTHSGNGEAGF